MKKITLGLLAVITLLVANNNHAQTLGGALNKVKNTARDVRTTKKEVEATSKEFEGDKKDKKKGSTETSKSTSSNTSSTTSDTETSDNKEVKNSSSRKNTEPTILFFNDMDNPIVMTSFTGSDPIIFIFDYGMSLEDFFEKELKFNQSMVEWTLSIHDEYGAELYSHSEEVIKRYGSKEQEPQNPVAFLQVGEKYIGELKDAANRFPEAVLSTLHHGTQTLSYTFIFRSDKNTIRFKREGTFTYNFRLEDMGILERHLDKPEKAEKYRARFHTTPKSSFHEKQTEKIVFLKGSPNSKANNESQFVSTIDLTQPFSVNAYLDAPMYTIKARRQKIGEYDYVAPIVVKKYYINGKLIATYSDQIEQETYKQETVLSDVLVPANTNEFKKNEMRIGVLAHVFSSLSAGTHKLKVEYFTVISTAKPSSTGSAATEYDNKELLVASGEVDLKIDANALSTYCKTYGRPKYGKGVLQGQTAIETQVKSLIQGRGHTPVYIYAEDNWKLYRDVWGNVTSREVLVYYIFTNENGRCEVRNFYITQDYDGRNYLEANFSKTKTSEPFPFVCCQNY